MYEKVKEMAKKPYIRYASLAHEIDRHNKITPTPVASFQRAIFLPFLDNLLEQIDAPFNGLSEVVLLGLLLISANLQNLNKSSQKKLTQYYSPDLPLPSSLSQELGHLRQHWYGISC